MLVRGLLHSQTLTETKFTAQDGSANDSFGFAVALQGDYAFVGAPGYRTERGAAYVFQHSPDAGGSLGWRELAKLVASDGTNEDFFGCAVALSAEYALIGARNDNARAQGTGAAYLFKLQDSTWQQSVKLATRTGETNEFFGNAVALAGDYALIGAPGEQSSSGAAYIFKRENSSSGESWREQARLQASDAANEDYFGIAVALTPDFAAVGAYGDDDRGSNAGAVYLFQRALNRGVETWVESFKLKATDGEANDFFGVALAASGAELLIGAYGDDDAADHAGAAYIFARRELNGDIAWQQQAKLTGSDGAANDDLGSTVALAGDYALLGALMQFNQGTGAAYLFKREGGQWHETAKVTAQDGELNDRFGNAVALNQEQALVGARYESTRGNHAGAAYLYEGLAEPASVRDAGTAPPGAFVLEQNFPNPCNPTTVFRFALLRPADVTLKLYNLQGAEVATLLVQPLAAGVHQVPWHAGSLANGVYFYCLRTGDFARTMKLVILR